MNTNKVTQGVAAGAKQVVLAGLVFVTALAFTVIAMNSPEKKVDSVLAAVDPATITDFATCQSNGGTLGCKDTATLNCTYTYNNNGTSATKGPYTKGCGTGATCDKGLCLASCTYNGVDPQGDKSKPCLENNQVCLEKGVCSVGCYGYDFSGGQAGKLKVIPFGEKTCAKPGQDVNQAESAPDATYICGNVPFRNTENNKAGTAKQILRLSSGTLSVSQIGLTYNENDENQNCIYGSPCLNNNCTGKTNTCSKMATQINAAFVKFLEYKTNGTITKELEAIKNNTALKDSEKTTQMAAVKNQYKNVLLGILGEASINKTDGEKIMIQLEKMIFPENYAVTENLLWAVKNDGTVPLIKSQTLQKTQIACQHLNSGATNRWCPADDSSDFNGFSYACVENALNNCDLFSWVIGGDTKPCPLSNGSPVNVPEDSGKSAFEFWKENGFKKDGVIDGKIGFKPDPSDDSGLNGILTGAAGNGCAYETYVSPKSYVYNSSTGTFDMGSDGYVEINKGFTGECWSSGDAQAGGGSGETPVENKLGCAAPATDDCSSENNPSSSSSGSGSTTYTYSIDSYTCQGNKPFICQDDGSGPGWVKDEQCGLGDAKTCESACDCQENPEGKCATTEEDCPDGKYCVFSNLAQYNAAKNGTQSGTCGVEACQSRSNSYAAFAKNATVCGANNSSSATCVNPSGVSTFGWDEKSCDEKGCDAATGKCKDGSSDECADISINTGNANETTGSCGNRSCNGVCVPFTVQETGECTSITCTVTNDYDGGRATGYQSGSGSQWYACMTPKSYSSNSSSSGDNSKGSSPSNINYTIKCTDSASGQTDTAEGSCKAPQNDDNNFKKAEDEANEDKAKEGETCTKDSDCQEGLVCEDGKCMSAEDAKDKGEGESCTKDSECRTGLVCQDGKCMTKEDAEENAEAPTVSITSPTGNVTAKTAQLSVTTNISANCKYMDVTNGGSFDASSFAGSGMTMSSAGYTHIATLTSLADTANTSGTSSDCKKTHNLVVLCQNSKASNQSNTSSIGSAQTSFTVDLSGNTEYAPTVSNAMGGDLFTVANPVLKVNTNQPSLCQYKEGSTFTYGSGTDFTTSGSYNHNTELSGLTSKDYTYYVVCKDAATCAASTALTVNFKVTLEGGDSSMTIASATAATQTVSNPTLSVTTDIPAICQYSTSNFTYGNGTQFANDNDYSHTTSLSALTDGSYSFYVNCKEKESGKIKNLTTPIQTTLDRSGAKEGEPVVSNTTAANQSSSTVILSITTTAAAKCQYGENEFSYGSGTQFTTDGDTGHSVQLKNVSDGEHTYYVVCKDTATGKTNSTPVQITFTVSNTAAVCADLDSNDRQSDEERDYDDSDSSDSKYAWRSIESGTRDEFTKVDWYAGYQFTPDKDGYVSQLCGYFAEDQSNDVILYNGSYKELAKTSVEGTGDWECVSITPVSVKTDKRYYVVARVKNGPIYYEYESGLLPGDADNVVIESGVRQLGDQDFGEDIFKYDYMVFGLVDVKISFADESSEGPSVEVDGPIGSIDKNTTTLAVTTDENATCKFSREDIEYSDMEYDFGQTGGKTHEQKICKLDDGNFTFYVRCKNEDDDENDASTLIQFEVTD